MTRQQAVWAAAYAAGEDGWSQLSPARRSSAAVLASLRKPSRVLDVGTGRGVDAELFAAAGHTVTGIDLVRLPEWIDITTRWPRTRFEAGALADHVPEQPYDVIFDAGCLHHQDPATLLGHLRIERSLLQADGVLWLATLHAAQAGGMFAPAAAKPDADGGYTLAFTEPEIAGLLAEAGLTVVMSTLTSRGRVNGLDDLLVQARRLSTGRAATLSWSR